MSSQENLDSGKDDFTVSELVTALADSKTQVPAAVDHALGSEPSTTVATEADWEKFWVAVNKIDVPVTSLIEFGENGPVQSRVSAGTAISAIGLVITIAETLWKLLQGWDDKAGRSEWTKSIVSQAYQADNRFNYVVVSTKHKVNFQGVQNTDWAVRTFTYKLAIGSVRYTLYAFRSGVFSLIGDGGFLNWAFVGRVSHQDPDSKRPRNVVFVGA